MTAIFFPFLALSSKAYPDILISLIFLKFFLIKYLDIVWYYLTPKPTYSERQLKNPVLIERQWSKRSVNRILKSGLRCGRSSSEHKVLDTRQAKPEKETICFRIATSLVIPYEAYRSSECVRISNLMYPKSKASQNIIHKSSQKMFEKLF